MPGDAAQPAASAAVWAENPSLESVARAIAGQWELPFLPSPSQPQAGGSYDLLLAVAPNPDCEYQLELRDPARQRTKLFIDYTHGEIAYRAQHGGGRKQALARAMGLKPGHLPSVIDATAGLGRDAFVLANLGCSVRMIERSPVMACLLKDALRRAVCNERLKPWIARRLQLVSGDALELVPVLSRESPADAIYIDPMYPPREKSALVKKEMRFIQALAGNDLDSAALLGMAMRHATNRVVVKRPGYAAPVAGPQPSHTIESKNTRYDVYIVH